MSDRRDECCEERVVEMLYQFQLIEVGGVPQELVRKKAAKNLLCRSIALPPHHTALGVTVAHSTQVKGELGQLGKGLLGDLLLKGGLGNMQPDLRAKSVEKLAVTWLEQINVVHRTMS